MSDAFGATVAALFAELGLPAPRLRAGKPATIEVDGRAVRLSPTSDERGILVSASPGPLSADPLRAEGQMRRLLRDGCGLVLGRRAALRLGADGRSAEVQAYAPCEPRALADVIAAVEDVLFLCDVHAPTLAERGGPAAPHTVHVDPADSLIFRL